MSAPQPNLIDQIERDKIRRAEQMSPGDRLLAGPRLFDLASEFTKAGLRSQHPGASEDRIHELFRERLRRVRQMERAE